MRFLVLQHIACEHPGLLARLMKERGVEWNTVEVDEGKPIPDPRAYDALLAFGGPMNVDEEDEHAWLAAEKRAIASTVREGVPYLGVCLGAQLLARALGAHVYATSEPEVGLLEVDLTDEARADPLFASLPDPLPCLQWHGDTFDLPAGSTLLATSAACRNQAFRWGEAAYGFQFHLEVTQQMAEEWGAVPAYRASMEAMRGPQGLDELRSQLAAHARRLEQACAGLFDGFLGIVERARTAASAQKRRARSS